MLFDLGHGVVIFGAFGPVIELRIAEGHWERAVPHQLFDHLQRGARIEERGGKRMPQCVGPIALSDPRQGQVTEHPVADLPGTEGQAALPSHTTREDLVCRRPLESVPLPQGGRDIGRQLDDPIHLPLTGIDAQGALGHIERRPA